MILCCDTASTHANLLVCDPQTGEIAAEICKIAERDFLLSTAFAELYAQAQVKPHQLSKIIVNLGPGSYTGIRTGLAAIEAYRLALPDMAIFGISSLAVTAGMSAKDGLTLATAAAKRQDFYWQLFDRKTALTDPQASHGDEIAAAISRHTGRLTLIGSDAARLLQNLDEGLRTRIDWDGHDIHPSAEDFLAWHNQHPEIGKNNLTPLYLKPPQTSVAKFKRDSRGEVSPNAAAYRHNRAGGA